LQRVDRTLLHEFDERSDPMIAVHDLKRTHRVTWAAGDYAAVAEHIDEAPPRDLLAAADLQPGLDVLDVATGTGNIALRAAAAGCTVVGLDLTPSSSAQPAGAPSSSA
jgi:2-polyprenyl-3-methyl-5-hydroxy-6-metoxy-1,4-benzoquinol methylase